MRSGCLWCYYRQEGNDDVNENDEVNYWINNEKTTCKHDNKYLQQVNILSVRENNRIHMS